MLMFTQKKMLKRVKQRKLAKQILNKTKYSNAYRGKNYKLNGKKREFKMAHAVSIQEVQTEDISMLLASKA